MTVKRLLWGVFVVGVAFALVLGLTAQGPAPSSSVVFARSSAPALPSSSVRLARSVTPETGPLKLAGIGFGPVDAVKNEVENLHEKANDHWKQIWQRKCSSGDNKKSDCPNSGIPDRVWTYWQNNPGNSPTGFSSIVTATHTDDESSSSADTVAATRLAQWTSGIGGAVSSSPTVDDQGETAYVGSHDGRVYAIDLDAGGSVHWSYKTGAAVQASPTVGTGGAIYVGSQDGTLYALNPDGSLAWSTSLDDWVLSSPALDAGGTLYVGTIAGTLYAIDAATGSVDWTASLDGRITSAPALSESNTTLYVGTWDEKLYKINRTNGNVIWTFGTDGAIKSPPALDAGNNIYFGSSDSSVYSVDSAGSQRWETTTGGAVRSGPVLASSGHVYVGSFDHKLYKLDQTSGTVAWTFETGREVVSTPIVGNNGRVYVGSRDDDFYAINSDGSGQWKLETGGAVASSANVWDTDGVAPALGLVGSGDGNLYAVSIQATGTDNSDWPKFQRTDNNSGSALGASPAIQVIAPATSHDTNVTPIALRGTTVNADGGDSVEVLVNGTLTDSAAVQGGGAWSADTVTLNPDTNTIDAILYQAGLASAQEDTVTLTVNYDTQVLIDPNSVRAADGIDTLATARLGGDTFLRSGRDITHRVRVRDADTVTMYYNRTGDTPTLADTALPMTNPGADTWEATIPASDLSLGDTVSFMIEAQDHATNAGTEARTDTGYQYSYDQPLHTGPVWYVNDGNTGGDSYTAGTGSDANNGSSRYPFRTVSHAMTQVSAGDTVRIDAGTYGETVTIDTNALALVGVDSSATVLNYGDSTSSTGAGVLVTSGISSVEVEKLKITNAYTGLKILSDLSEFVSLRIESNGNDGVVSDGLGGHFFEKLVVQGNELAGLEIVDGSNLVQNVISRNNQGEGFRISGNNNNILNSKIVSNGSDGFIVDPGTSQNRFTRNLVRGNTPAGFNVGGSGHEFYQNFVAINSNNQFSFGPTATNVRVNKNNFGTRTNADSVADASLSDTVEFTRNYWNTTNRVEISNRIADRASDTIIFSPYRLGKIDTGVGADTLTPDTTPIVSVVEGSGTATLTWNEATFNEDGTTMLDFLEYRLYRDTSPLLSNWKDSATVVATVTTATDTNYTDTSVQNGDTYYYRISVVDDKSVDGGDGTSRYENESFFSDTAEVRPASKPLSIDTTTVSASDGFDTLANSAGELDGTFQLSTTVEANAFTVLAENADTVVGYFRTDGTKATTADTAAPGYIAGSDVRGDTWRVVVDEDSAGIGDTMNFFLEARQSSGDTAVADRSDSGYQYAMVDDTFDTVLASNATTTLNGDVLTAGDTVLTTGDTHTITATVKNADTVTMYYRTDGSTATISDSSAPMSMTGDNPEYDTWSVSFGPTVFEPGDTVNFVVITSRKDGDTEIADGLGTSSGLQYRVIAPIYQGPVWYVNDDSTAGDSFTKTTGNDTFYNGSDTWPFRTLNYAMTRVTAGDTVKVDSGIYAETVAIDTPGLSLVGADSESTIIDGSGSGQHGLYVRANATGMRIEDLAVKNAAVAGIVYDGADSGVIRRVSVESNGSNSGAHGIALKNNADTNLVVNNYAANNGHHGFHVTLTSFNNILRSNLAESNGSIGAGEGFGFSVEDSSRDVRIDSNVARNNNSGGYELTTGVSNVRLVRNTANGQNAAVNGFVSSSSVSNVQFDTNVARNYTSSGYDLGGLSSSVLRGNVSDSNGLHGFLLFNSSQDNRLVHNVATKNGNASQGAGFYLNNLSGTTVLEHNLSEDNLKGVRLEATNVRLTQNRISDNSSAQVSLETGAAADTAHQNVIRSGTGADTLIASSITTDTFSFERNWYDTTDRTVINSGVTGTGADSVIWSPYRLGTVDTAPGADTIITMDPTGVSITANISNRIDVSWDVTSVDADFAEYRVYRDTSGTLTDWKNDATVVATVTNGSTTSYVDSGLVAGDTYHYRVTAVDNATPENESFFSDTLTAVAKFWDTGAANLTARFQRGSDLDSPRGDTTYVFGGAVNGSISDTIVGYTDTSGWGPTSLGTLQTARYKTATAATSDTIFIVGGETISGGTDVVRAYDLNTNAWDTYTRLPVRNRDAQASVINDTLYVFGGFTGAGQADTEVFTYPLSQGSNGTWDTGVVPNLPTARFAHEAIKTTGGVYLIGGNDGSAALSSVDFYDSATATWSAMSAMPSQQSGQAAVVKGDTIYSVGGVSGGSALADVNVYDISADAWSTGPDLPTARQVLMGGLSGNTIVISGGLNTASTSVKTVNRARP